MGRGTGIQRELGKLAAIHPEERRLAAVVGGAFLLLASVTLAGMVAGLGYARGHEALLTGIAAATAAVGALVLVRPRPELRFPGAMHALPVLGLAGVAVIVAASGGARSPAWVYVLFPAFFAAYFYPWPVAMGFLLACAAVQALPLLYDARATHDRFLAELVIAVPAYLSLGLGVSIGKRRMWSLRTRAEMLAAEQGGLRRVATAVVGGQPAERIYEMVARELGRLLRCDGAGILRLKDSGTLTVVGSHGERPGGLYRPGTVVEVQPGTDVERALRSGVPIRIDRHAPDAPAAHLGYRATIVSPVKVGERTWGLLAVAAVEPDYFDAEDEQTLVEFGDLLATAITSADEQARLAEQALSDPLTGLANHRALQARLEAELARGARRGSPLSVAMIDIDHFKVVNDSAGHETGDQMLVRVAAALNSFARAEDTLGRVGGDEFAWILPDTTREQALVAVDRARRLIAAAPADPYRITVSAGICDSDSATDPARLIALADSALYWSKAHGRNQSWIYDPAVVEELSAQQRAQRMARAQAVEGLRAVVQAHEARHPATHEHSDRVATLAFRLALAAGWPRDRALRMREAAQLHDVGAVTEDVRPVPNGASLTERELDQLRAGAELSRRMVDGVLDPDQVEWIGGQYQLDGGASAEPVALGGAALLALADAWDTMTAVALGRPEAALSECRRLAGRYFDRGAVQHLVALWEAGELGPEAPPAGDAVSGEPV